MNARRLRRNVMRQLVELQVLAIDQLSGSAPESPSHREFSLRLKDWLAETACTLRTELARARPSPLDQAMVLEGLRSDLEWFANILAHLEREKPPPLAALLDVELERLRSSLGTPLDRHPDPRDEALRHACERMQADVLGRRLRCEVARPVNGCAVEALWMQRFHLSRLQARYSARSIARVRARRFRRRRRYRLADRGRAPPRRARRRRGRSGVGLAPERTRRALQADRASRLG